MLTSVLDSPFPPSPRALTIISVERLKFNIHVKYYAYVKRMFTFLFDSHECRNVPHLTCFVLKMVTTEVFTEMHSGIH